MTPSPSPSKHLPLQDVRIALGYVVVHALELGDVLVNDGCDQPLGRLSVVDVGRVVSIAQNVRPDLLVHPIIVGVCCLDDLSRRAGRSDAVAFVFHELF